MIRKVSALFMFLLFGLYLPAAVTPVCLCIGPSVVAEDSCCHEEASCCTETADGARICCDDPECCLHIAGLPDGMEPQPTSLPHPLAAPLPVIVPHEFVVEPVPTALIPRDRFEAAAPPGDPVRIAFGVWRL